MIHVEEPPAVINDWRHEDLAATFERLRFVTPDALGPLECAALAEALRDSTRSFEARYMDVLGVLDRLAHEPYRARHRTRPVDQLLTDVAAARRARENS